jgi:hypothetical protein
MLDRTFAELAAGFSEQFGAPFHEATAVWPGTPAYDDGGSIVTPGTPVSDACKVQVSAPTEAMRGDAGFVATDMRLLVLAASLGAVLGTEAKIVIPAGIHAGSWELHSVTRDPAGIGWNCRGRRVP